MKTCSRCNEDCHTKAYVLKIQNKDLLERLEKYAEALARLRDTTSCTTEQYAIIDSVL